MHKRNDLKYEPVRAEAQPVSQPVDDGPAAAEDEDDARRGAAHAALDDETEDETVAENAGTGEARRATLGANAALPVGDGAAEKGAASSPPDEEAVPGRSPRRRSENARGRPDRSGAWPSMAASDEDDSVMDGAGPGTAAAPAAPADETLMGEAVAEPGTRRGAAGGMDTSRARRRPRASPARTGGAASASGGARTGAGAGTVWAVQGAMMASSSGRRWASGRAWY